MRWTYSFHFWLVCDPRASHQPESPTYPSRRRNANPNDNTMSATLNAFLRSWPPAPWLSALLLLVAAIYFRGWRLLHLRDPARWNAGRLAAFLCGLAAIFLALA